MTNFMLLRFSSGFEWSENVIFLAKEEFPKVKIETIGTCLEFYFHENIPSAKSFSSSGLVLVEFLFVQWRRRFVKNRKRQKTNQMPLRHIFTIWATNNFMPEKCTKSEHIFQIADNMINGFWCLGEIRIKNVLIKYFCCLSLCRVWWWHSLWLFKQIICVKELWLFLFNDWT